MPRDYDTPIPVETVRDLLGLTRALYAAFVELGPAYDEQRWAVKNIGYQLRLALQRAGEGGPGTFPHRAAWLIASKAVADLGELVGDTTAKSLITATGERLAKKR